MYIMTINGRPFYHPYMYDLALERPRVSFDGNTIGSMTFIIHNSHPEYDNIKFRRSVFTLYQDSEIVSKFRPVKRRMTFQGGVEWTCEELTGLLNDLMRRPTYTDISGTDYTYMSNMLNAYNAARSASEMPGTPGGVVYLTPEKCDYYCRQCRWLPHACVGELNYWMLYFGYGGNSVENPSSDVQGWRVFTRLPATDNAGEESYPVMKYGGETSGLAMAVNAFQRAHGLTEKYYFDAQEDLPVLLDMISDVQNETPPEPAESEINMSFVAAETAYTQAHTDTNKYEDNEYMGYWDLLVNKLTEGREGVYIVPVWGETTCTLKLMDADSLPLSSQKISFGENLADLFVDLDSEETCSVLIPLGKAGG